MSSPSSRRSTVSNSQTHLAPPAPGSTSKTRRMTSPSLPPPAPLDLPEPVTYGARRPPSPLRRSVTVDPNTGEVINDDGSFSGESDGEEWGERPVSPTVAQIAANVANKVGSIVSNMSSRSQTRLPTDAELEAEAARERDRTRREAERILSREADAKRLEQRVQAMLEDDLMKPLPPPARPGTPPSPASSSTKEGGGWLTSIKQKLTPTKEPLTPAQQIILDTKAREKELEKEEKRLERERKELEKEMKKSTKKLVKQRSKEWPSSPERKYSDPTFLQLSGAPSAPSMAGPPRPITPASPTPVRAGGFATPPSLAASPRRSRDNLTGSPARSSTPVYAQFTPDGTLDVGATLITIASRFEKLERWTVGHVRALEERMDDVERWLVEKEKEGEQSSGHGVMQHQTGEPATFEAAVSELRDELAEVQGRIGELGREVAKMVVSPGNLSSGPSRTSAPVGRAPSTSSSVALRSMSSTFVSPPRTSSSPGARESSPVLDHKSSTLSGTRLPYPTGDYATPPDTVVLTQGAFSPPGSPPAPKPQGISGLPGPGLEFGSAQSSPSGLPQSSSSASLPRPPSAAEIRTGSVSPTPRKRYTVALGGPIMKAERRERDTERTAPAPRSRSVSRERDRDRNIFSASPVSSNVTLDLTDESDSGGNDETIGRASARQAARVSKFLGYDKDASVSGRQSRPRPQSMYSRPVGSSTQNLAAPSPVTPLNTRMRSQSTDRFGLALNDPPPPVPATPTSAKFVDPLETRRRTQEALASAAPPAPKIGPGNPKVPIGKLVAFFDQGK